MKKSEIKKQSLECLNNVMKKYPDYSNANFINIFFLFIDKQNCLRVGGMSILGVLSTPKEALKNIIDCINCVYPKFICFKETELGNQYFGNKKPPAENKRLDWRYFDTWK